MLSVLAAKGKDVKMQIIPRDVGVWSGFSAHLLVFFVASPR
jgi:hypothetical protein